MVSAEPAWNRKGLPLAYAFALSWLAAWILMPHRGVATAIWVPIWIIAVVLVRWTNGAPAVESGLSGYSKTGHSPAEIDIRISCRSQADSSASTKTNALMWSVNLGLGYTSSKVLPAIPVFQAVDTPARLAVRSGRQGVVRLLEHSGEGSERWGSLILSRKPKRPVVSG